MDGPAIVVFGDLFFEFLTLFTLKKIGVDGPAIVMFGDLFF